MKRVSGGKWKYLGAASDWQCDSAATPAVMKDLFSYCTYGASANFYSPSLNIECIESRPRRRDSGYIVCTTFNNGRMVLLRPTGPARLLGTNTGYPFRRGTSPVLPYGTSWYGHAFTCESRQAGVRCTSNEGNRRGFLIAREGIART
jgi:hypothetical protein